MCLKSEKAKVQTGIEFFAVVECFCSVQKKNAKFQCEKIEVKSIRASKERFYSKALKFRDGLSWDHLRNYKRLFYITIFSMITYNRSHALPRSMLLARPKYIRCSWCLILTLGQQNPQNVYQLRSEIHFVEQLVHVRLPLDDGDSV